LCFSSSNEYRGERKKKAKRIGCCSIRTTVVCLFYICVRASAASFFIMQNKSVICACWCLFYVDLKYQKNQSYCLYITTTASYLIYKNKTYSLSDTIIYACFQWLLFFVTFSSGSIVVFFLSVLIAFWPHQHHMQVFTHTTIWSYALSVYIALFRSRNHYWHIFYWLSIDNYETSEFSLKQI
jgi:hypothetical protein